MRRPHQRRVPLPMLWILSLLLPAVAGAANRPALSLRQPGPAFGCAEISGEFVLLLDSSGATLISAADFPGGRLVGRIDAGRLKLNRQVAHQTSLQTDGDLPAGTEVFGWRVPGVETQGHGGCIGFDHASFTWPGDLASYARWLVRDLYVPLAERGWLAGKRLHIGDRSVHLEVEPAGHRAVMLTSVEAGITGLDLPDGRRYFFRPVLLGDASHAAVMVTRGKGKVYSSDGQELLALVQVRTDVPRS
jgi:hypothetical protein